MLGKKIVFLCYVIDFVVLVGFEYVVVVIGDDFVV